MTHQSLLYPPETQTRLLHGVEQFADLLAATLGPRQGIVLSQQGTGKPEILDESGSIARREVTDLLDAGADVGAMLMRQLAQQMHKRYRDGAALAGVLCRAMLREAVPMIAAGHNPMLLRTGMMCGTAAAVEHLTAQSQPIQGQQMLKQAVMTTIWDEELSDVLSEMFDLLGEHGAYMVEEYAAPYIDREYIDGGRWRARPAAWAFMPPGNAELTLTNPLVVDEKIDDLNLLRPALEGVVRIPAKPPLLIVARNVTGEALKALMLNATQGKLNLGVDVRSPWLIATTHLNPPIVTLGSVILVQQDSDWKQATAPANALVRRIIGDPSHLIALTATTGLIQSFDGGLTWEPYPTPDLDPQQIMDIASADGKLFILVAGGQVTYGDL